MSTVLSLLVALLTLISVSLYRRYTFFRSRGIPGPRPLPLIGNLLDSRQKPWFSVVRKHTETYGKIYGIFNGWNPRLVVSDPQFLKKIMVKDHGFFTDKIHDRFEHPIEQKMIFMLWGEEWMTWRKAVTPAYTSQKLRAMMPLFSRAAEHLVNEVERRIVRSGSVGETTIEVRDFVTLYTMEVIATTGLGIDMDLSQQSSPMIEAVKQYFTPSHLNVILGMVLPTWFKRCINFTAYNSEGLYAMEGIIKAVIAERRKQQQEEQETDANEGKRTFIDFTSALMEAKLDVANSNRKRSPTDDEIVSNIMALFAAGFGTPALMIASAILLIAQHPEVQERLMREVRTAAVKGLDDADSFRDMVFMEAVFNESLRLFPPATLNERRTSDVYDWDGVLLPKGLDILISVYTMHHDSQYFPDPESFDPDRFMPGRIEDMDKFAFQAFGHGPRVCPGVRFAMLESKVLLTRLLMDFDFVSAGSHYRDIDVKETMDELLLTSDMMVTFQKRKSQ